MGRLERSAKSLSRIVGGALGFGAGYLGTRAVVDGLKSVTTAAMEAEESENLFAVSMDNTAAAARAWSSLPPAMLPDRSRTKQTRPETTSTPWKTATLFSATPVAAPSFPTR